MKYKTKLTLGFSPCPNDTFMFDAIVNHRIKNDDFGFDVVLDDVESLNRRAMEGELDVTKISFAVYNDIKNNYQILSSGSALGNGVGPLFISKKKFSHPENEIRSVAIPGFHTTAFRLFKKFYPSLTFVKEMVFSEIEDAIIQEKVDAGVIIHENRFTYEKKGLEKIADLGNLWEESTSKPIPLGGIVIKRSFPEHLKKKINRMIRESVQFAFSNPEASFEYVKTNAQEMSEEVRRKHIQLYVNEFSLDLGITGKEAVNYFLNISDENGNFVE
jgi:1,4-dihydroxy-6-naphthoate synthase